MNDQNLPLCVSLTPALTPANPRHERALGAVRVAALDAATLPYRQDLLRWLEQQRAGGRSVVLVTDDDLGVAQQVAAHLDVFDEVLLATGDGTPVDRRLDTLTRHYGAGGFDYVGGEASDIKVWKAARRAVVVGNDSLQKRVAAALPIERSFVAATPTLRTWLKAVRLHQWVKNALIFLPVLLAHKASDPAILSQTLLAFLAFGCCASSVYLTNDMLDLVADRRHPRKRNRAFAAGLLSVRSGAAVALALTVCAIGLAVIVGGLYPAVLGGYYLLTWAYSLRLKREALVDVMVLAALYTLRIIAGCAATRIDPSFWLLAFSVFIFLSLGFVKRYAEIADARKAAAGPVLREAMARKTCRWSGISVQRPDTAPWSS
jgi:4-hydroxybenzoate polyprenyltransferase